MTVSGARMDKYLATNPEKMHTYLKKKRQTEDCTNNAIISKKITKLIQLFYLIHFVLTLRF